MTSFQQLTQHLTDTTQPVATRRAAVMEIAGIGGDQALPFIINALADIAPGVRREAANALKQYNSQEAIFALMNAIKDEDNDLTLWTLIEVLGIIGTTTELPQLNELFSTTLSPLTRREIQKSIDQITDRHSDSETAELSETVHDELTDPIDSTDMSQTADLELEESNLDSEGGSYSEVDVQSDNTLTESDSVMEHDQISSDIDDENSVPKHIEVSVVEIADQEEQQSDESSQEESTDTEVVSDEQPINSQDETDSEQDLEVVKSSLKKLGSSPTLPVLVPNTSVVIYENEEQSYKPSTFALMLRPSAYLSKQWVSRTRLYLVLFCLLIGATVALVYSQVQRHPRSPYVLKPEIVYMEDPEKYLSAGIFFIQERDYRSAIETLEFIRGVDTINPDMSDVYRNLGFAYFQENQYALSVESYEYYLQIRKNKVSQPFVAEASFSSNDSDEDKQDSSDYKTYNMLGTAYARLGNLNKARTAYENAIKIAPYEPEAYSNLAILYSDGFQQKPLLTEALAYAAVRLNPDVAAYHDTLGWILGKKGQINRATESLAHAIRLQRDYVPAHYHLSEVAQKTQNNKGIELVQNDLIKKIRPTTKSRTDMLDVLSYIYETSAQKIPRFNPSLMNLRGIKK